MPPTPPPRRKSLHLKDYDYSQPGGYFITTVTQHRVCLFGNFDENQLLLNAAGSMIEHWWQEIANKFPTVSIDTYVVMPDHFHGLVMIGTSGQSHRIAPTIAPTITPTPIPIPTNITTIAATNAPTNAPTNTPTVSLPEIVQWFKTMTTNAYIRGVKEFDWQPFPGKLWQRNYYEHVVRSDEELNRIRQYIENNPRRGLEDRNVPGS